MPAHCRSWGKGYPNLTSFCPHYIDRQSNSNLKVQYVLSLFLILDFSPHLIDTLKYKSTKKIASCFLFFFPFSLLLLLFLVFVLFSFFDVNSSTGNLFPSSLASILILLQRENTQSTSLLISQTHLHLMSLKEFYLKYLTYLLILIYT